MEKIKRIGKNGDKIGMTTFTGEGAAVKVKEPDNAVAVRDYVASKGYSGIVDWDGDTPTVAGEKIKPLFINDGIAYVDKNEADNAIAKMEKSVGIIGADGAEKARAEKYGQMEDKALSAATGREPFSYNPDSDPVYKAYEKKYRREAEDALRRVLNDNNTSVTGASGAVLSEAIAAQNKELSKLTDVIPELYESAYDRYYKEAQLLYDSLDSIRSVADAYYERLYERNSDATDRVNTAGEREREEKQRWTDNELSELEKQMLYEELKVYPEKMRLELTQNRIDNEATAIENAIARGFFTSSDEAALSWLSQFKNESGGYSLDPSLALVAHEYQVANAKERGKINAKLGL